MMEMMETIVCRSRSLVAVEGGEKKGRKKKSRPRCSPGPGCRGPSLGDFDVVGIGSSSRNARIHKVNVGAAVHPLGNAMQSRKFGVFPCPARASRGPKGVAQRAGLKVKIHHSVALLRCGS